MKENSVLSRKMLHYVLLKETLKTKNYFYTKSAFLQKCRKALFVKFQRVKSLLLHQVMFVLLYSHQMNDLLTSLVLMQDNYR